MTEDPFDRLLNSSTPYAPRSAEEVAVRLSPAASRSPVGVEQAPLPVEAAAGDALAVQVPSSPFAGMSLREVEEVEERSNAARLRLDAMDRALVGRRVKKSALGGLVGVEVDVYGALVDIQVDAKALGGAEVRGLAGALLSGIKAARAEARELHDRIVDEYSGEVRG